MAKHLLLAESGTVPVPVSTEETLEFLVMELINTQPLGNIYLYLGELLAEAVSKVSEETGTPIELE